MSPSGARRYAATVPGPLDRVKAVKTRPGQPRRRVVLAMCAGTSRYLDDNDALPDAAGCDGFR